MRNPIRLLLVDRPALSRRCLAAMLNRRRQLQVVGEAASGSEAIARARSLRPDLALVEPEVPEGGPQLITDLCRALPGGAVMVLTLGGQPTVASKALRAGARGYLHKDCTPEELVRAIERVSQGELVIEPLLTEAVLDELSGRSHAEPALANLTERESDVLTLIARGQTNAEIARELTITEHTVKDYVAKLLSKLGLDNRVQLATYAVQQGQRIDLPHDGASTDSGPTRNPSIG